jgi:hypothetical protein
MAEKRFIVVFKNGSTQVIGAKSVREEDAPDGYVFFIDSNREIVGLFHKEVGGTGNVGRPWWPSLLVQLPFRRCNVARPALSKPRNRPYAVFTSTYCGSSLVCAMAEAQANAVGQVERISRRESFKGQPPVRGADSSDHTWQASRAATAAATTSRGEQRGQLVIVQGVTLANRVEHHCLRIIRCIRPPFEAGWLGLPVFAKLTHACETLP